LTEKLDNRDATDGLWVLKRQENSGAGAGVSGPRGDVFAIEQDPSFGDGVSGVTHNDVGKG